jgi:hypothetical protein
MYVIIITFNHKNHIFIHCSILIRMHYNIKNMSPFIRLLNLEATLGILV